MGETDRWVVGGQEWVSLTVVGWSRMDGIDRLGVGWSRMDGIDRWGVGWSGMGETDRWVVKNG